MPLDTLKFVGGKLFQKHVPKQGVSPRLTLDIPGAPGIARTTPAITAKPKPRAMEFPVTREAIEKILPPTRVPLAPREEPPEPTFLVSPLSEVLRAAKEREQARRVKIEEYKAKNPERVAQLDKSLVGFASVSSDLRNRLVKKGKITQEEANLFASAIDVEDVSLFITGGVQDIAVKAIEKQMGAKMFKIKSLFKKSKTAKEFAVAMTKETGLTKQVLDQKFSVFKGMSSVDDFFDLLTFGGKIPVTAQAAAKVDISGTLRSVIPKQTQLGIGVVKTKIQESLIKKGVAGQVAKEVTEIITEAIAPIGAKPPAKVPDLPLKLVKVTPTPKPPVVAPPEPTEAITEDLAVEAKKFKSAEEFVEAQPKVFHGTNKKIGFGTGAGQFEEGVFFVDNRQVAKAFSEITPDFLVKEAGGKQRVIEAVVELDNPKVIDFKGNVLKGSLKKEINLAKQQGHDGLIIKNIIDVPTEALEKTTKPFTETIAFNQSSIKTKQQLTDIYNQATKEVKPTKDVEGLKAEAKELKAYEAEIVAVAKESSQILFKDIKDLGGIKSYRKGFLAEEMREIPLSLRNNTTGNTLDELADMLEDRGHFFEGNSDKLLEAILDTQKMARPVKVRRIAPTIRTLRTIAKTAPKKTATVSRRLLAKLHRIKYPKISAIEKAMRRAAEKGKYNPATSKQIQEAYSLAKEKAMISELGKVKPQYRRLAKAMTGKTTMKSMTEKEADSFIDALKKISEPYYKKGKLVPPPIPRGTKVVPKGFFEGMKFKEPTIIKYLTPQTYYSQILGVKPLVEPLELAKQRFDIVFRDMSNGVNKMIKLIDKLGKTTTKEKLTAKAKNKPTKAVEDMRNFLNEYEEAPPSLSPEEKEVFNWFRDLSRQMLKAENEVRTKLDIETIKYRQAYVRHTADAMAKEMLLGRYPFPEGLKYWSQRVVGKKIYNPMEFHRTLSEDLEKLWTRDLGHATKSMLWTALKEIHLTQPLQFFTEQLGAVSKDPLVYKTLTREEREIYDLTRTMPASTKNWAKDYVNQVIKGQETWFDTSVNALVTKTGLKGLLNKVLAPFGRTVGRQPITKTFQLFGRVLIHGVMGPIRPKQIIRNKFQFVNNLALYTTKSNVKAFYPASVDKNLKEILEESFFLKTYTGMEELPANVLGKLEKLNLAGFQWSAKSNVIRAMKTSYWDTLDLITNPKYKDFGWAAPERIALDYDVPKGKLYPSEKEKLIKEMEFGASATQYHYIPMAMPEVFRHKALTPFTRLQSWWMNYYFKFNREAVMRMFKGETGYGTKLPWSRRLGWIRYLILAGIILNTLGYERSYFYGAAPGGLPPTASFPIALYTYITTLDDLDKDWGKRQNDEAKRKMFYDMKTFIPGYLSYKDFKAWFSGEKSWDEYFFYKKGKEKPGAGVAPAKKKEGAERFPEFTRPGKIKEGREAAFPAFTR